MERTNKTALITGASSGIGYELAKVFAQEGHDLVLVARSEDQLRRIAQDLEQQCGARVRVIVKDLFEPNAAHELYEQVRHQGIVVNYLVNDAGQGVYGKFADTDLEQELKIIQLNVNSLVVLTKLFLQDMLARNEGRILQLGSMVSKNPAPWSAIYGGTKAFVYNFNQALIQELEGTQVTVTVLRPGATDTDFFHKAHAEEMEVVQKGQLGPADEVARDGYEAMMEGRNAVVSGLKNQLMDKAAQLMPDQLAAKQMKKMHQPATPDKRH
ncbi:MAG TPA: SDR family oxidoreductase [Solimonas sp.]